ncbi:MAG: DUF4258 domain-containing protein [Caldilinea sp.]
MGRQLAHVIDGLQAAHPGWEDVAEEIAEAWLMQEQRRPRQRRRPQRMQVQPPVQFTAHARLRICQRGLSEADIDAVLRYGRRFYAADAVIYFLGDRDLPAEETRHIGHLRGVGVILAPAQAKVITVWRNRRHGMRTIRRKLAAERGVRVGHRLRRDGGAASMMSSWQRSEVYT